MSTRGLDVRQGRARLISEFQNATVTPADTDSASSARAGERGIIGRITLVPDVFRTAASRSTTAPLGRRAPTARGFRVPCTLAAPCHQFQVTMHLPLLASPTDSASIIEAISA